MAINIFSFPDYKDYLKATIELAVPKRGYISQLAGAANCQRSYLSQVINSHVQLTPDHALGLCNFLRHTEKETDYFLLLVELARASSANLRDRIESKLKEFRKENLDLSKRLDAEIIDDGKNLDRYYSSWHWMAIHIIVSIPEFQNVQTIAQRLCISPVLVQNTLDRLMQMNCVQFKAGKWIYSGANRHLSNNSPSVNLHHNNWRQRSQLDSAVMNEESVHYTSVFSMSKKDYDHLRDKILKWIDDSREIMGPSKSEELVCFCVDFFKI